MACWKIFVLSLILAGPTILAAPSTRSVYINQVNDEDLIAIRRSETDDKSDWNHDASQESVPAILPSGSDKSWDQPFTQSYSDGGHLTNGSEHPTTQKSTITSTASDWDHLTTEGSATIDFKPNWERHASEVDRHSTFKGSGWELLVTNDTTSDEPHLNTSTDRFTTQTSILNSSTLRWDQPAIGPYSATSRNSSSTTSFWNLLTTRWDSSTSRNLHMAPNSDYLIDSEDNPTTQMAEPKVQNDDLGFGWLSYTTDFYEEDVFL